jgi:alkyl hydroperoxide reductase subunit AhpC
MQKELKALDKDLVHLAINSTHYMDEKAGAKYLKSYKLEMPALNDLDGTVGHLYGARTTPHMFVIDREGVLRYTGAIDDDSSGKKGEEATNYVVNAVQQIVAGETVSPDQTRSYGCGVKYAKK